MAIKPCNLNHLALLAGCQGLREIAGRREEAEQRAAAARAWSRMAPKRAGSASDVAH